MESAAAAGGFAKERLGERYGHREKEMSESPRTERLHTAASAVNAEGIPVWMTRENEYEPLSDRDGFISKSMLKMMSILTAAREDGRIQDRGASAPAKIIFSILAIVLMSCSRNMFFTYIMIAAVLVRCCFLPGRLLKKVIPGALGAALFSALILLPAVFFGSPKTMLTVSLKVFVSVTMINLLGAMTRWNRITEAFRTAHIPDVFIFTFDITLKYIVLLGEVCLHSLEALKLRSVGRNRSKQRAVSGVLGVTFLKSHEMADEMFDAMRCRGFEGEYRRGGRNAFRKQDLVLAAFGIVMIALFVYLQQAM